MKKHNRIFSMKSIEKDYTSLKHASNSVQPRLRKYKSVAQGLRINYQLNDNIDE